MFVKYQKAVCLSGALFALALTFASASAGTTKLPGAKIQGIIFQTSSGVSPDNSPVPAAGARVQLFEAATGKLVDQTRTDRRGRFNLLVKESGEYIIKASKRGSGTASQVLKVSDGDTLKTTLVLRIAPSPGT